MGSDDSRRSRFSLPFTLIAMGCVCVAIALIALYSQRPTVVQTAGRTQQVGTLQLQPAPYKTLSAHAFGVQASVLGVVTVGPLPSACSPASPPSCPENNSLATVSTSLVGASTLAVHAHIDNGAGTANASASVASVSVTTTLVDLSATVVKSSCTLNAHTANITASGTTSIATLKVNGVVPAAFSTTPAPNTTITISVAGVNVATLILNEQIPAPPQTTTITVNAIHLHLLNNSADVIVSESRCDP